MGVPVGEFIWCATLDAMLRASELLLDRQQEALSELAATDMLRLATADARGPA